MGIKTRVSVASRRPKVSSKLSYYEFFAGGGMARAGLGRNWDCLFANDFDPKKAEAYSINWGSGDLHVGDVAKVTLSQLNGVPSLVWGSFPCQDLSLAGAGAGLSGERSGTFWPFWRLIKKLIAEGRAPETIVLENVYGALMSHEGRDFAAIGSALSDAGYRFGAVVIDAVHFVPQSRPRLFVIGVRKSRVIPTAINGGQPEAMWHPPALVKAFGKLPSKAQSDWLWWNLPKPPKRKIGLRDIVEVCCQTNAT